MPPDLPIDDLFAALPTPLPAREEIGEGAVILRGFGIADAAHLIEAIAQIASLAPFRQMITPGGYHMSVAMTSCGPLGWVADRKGYRYTRQDPATGLAWPAMPGDFVDFAREAAATAGFPDVKPDSCLINRYEAGSKLSLHQDRDETDMSAPIVSLSLGLPATFQFGGLKRTDPVRRYRLEHGDVAVWGGPARLVHHGIAVLKPGLHPFSGPYRYNLTFRKAA